MGVEESATPQPPPPSPQQRGETRSDFPRPLGKTRLGQPRARARPPQNHFHGDEDGAGPSVDGGRRRERHPGICVRLAVAFGGLSYLYLWTPSRSPTPPPPHPPPPFCSPTSFQPPPSPRHPCPALPLPGHECFDFRPCERDVDQSRQFHRSCSHV